MKVADVMTRDVCLVNPDQTLAQAASLMSRHDIGSLPVGKDDRLIGMITDRDIAVRGVAKGKGPRAKVADVMSKEVKYCFEDEDLDHVSDNMADIQLRRLPVLDRDKRLVGILALGDLATGGAAPHAQKALEGISRAN
jgi:CBS domain-containing protein